MTIIVKKTSPLEKTINIKIETGNNNPIKYTFNQNQTPIKIDNTNNINKNKNNKNKISRHESLLNINSSN